MGKAASPAWRLFLLAVAAGVLIGLGAVTSSTAAHGLRTPGSCGSCRGSSSPVGLMMVILMGTELFTGNALMVTAAIDGQITWGGSSATGASCFSATSWGPWPWPPAWRSSAS